MTDTKKTILNGVLLVMILLKMCHCLTVYDLNRSKSKSYDDGTYRSSEHNNDEAFYQFGYKVNAIETGDIKQHIEKRVNNEVKGAYFLVEPNGVGRLVEYIANENGFNAVVRHQYGAKYSKNFDINNSTQINPLRQGHHANMVDENKTNDEEKLPQRQTVAFDRFRKEHNTEPNQQTNITYRQSSPKSITNQSSIFSLPENATENLGVLSKSAVTQTPMERPGVGKSRTRVKECEIPSIG